MSAVEVIKTEPLVCVCVCQFVSTLMAERFDVQSQNLVQTLTFMTSWTSMMVKVIGQRSKVKVTRPKNVISAIFLFE